MKYAPQLCQLPVDTNGLQPYAPEVLPLVVGIFMHNMVLGTIELVAELLRHAGNGVCKLIDDGVEE